MEKVLIAEGTTVLHRRVLVDAGSDGTEATQQGFLLRSLARPRDGIGIVQTVLRFREAFDWTLFHAAVQTVTDRHAPLRSAFVRMHGGFEERTARYAAVPAKVLDWRPQSEEAASEEWDGLLQIDRELGFDPAQAPLLRCTYVQLAHDQTWVLLTVHHLLVDGIALNWVLQEIVENYDCTRAHGQNPSSRRVFSRQPDAFPHAACSPEATANYWMAALQGWHNESPLASLRRLGPSSRAAQESVSIQMGEQASRTLHAAAMQCRCSQAAMIYAAWAVTLCRISQETDVAFLAIRSARIQPGAARTLGSLVRSSPLRLQIDARTSFSELARQADIFLKASEPFASARPADIKEWANVPEGVWDSNILFDRDRFTPWFEKSGAHANSRSAQRRQHSDVPLTLAVMRDRGLTLHCQYWSDAFRPGTVTDMTASLAVLLQHAADAPECPVGELAYLSAAQRRRLERSASLPANQTSTSSGPDLLLHAGFKAQAARRPDAPAVQWQGGSASYEQIDRASDALAARLLQQGLTREEPVAVLIDRSAAHLIALLGILKAGGAYLPLDSAHPDAHLQRIVSAARARRCLAQQATVRRAEALAAAVVTVTVRDHGAPGDDIHLPLVDPRQLAYLIATSGTTGLPKLVEIEHRAAANTLQHSLTSIYCAGDLALVPWTDSPAGDASIHQIFAALSAGGTLEPIAGIAGIYASPSFPRFTTFGATPSVLEILLASGTIPPRAATVLIGGEACPVDLPARLRAMSGVRRLMNVYGPTETAIYSTADDLMAADRECSNCPVSIGRPISNIRVEILDRHLQPVIPGATGELYIAGLGLARGYRDNPQATAKSFPELSGPDGGKRRCYRTGDLAAWLPDGRLELHGRVDRQVKVFGVRMELDSVERGLERLPGVARALVTAAPDASGKNRLSAWIVPQAGHHLHEVELRRLAREDLTSAMVPGTIAIIHSIPLTAAGKPDFTRLPVGVPESSADQRQHDEDSHNWSEREQLTASIWCRLLQHATFGRDDDFFAVGGDSLMAIELLLDLNVLLDIQLSGTLLCGAWTIQAIAEASTRAPASNSFFALGQHLQGDPQFWITPNADDFAMFNRREVTQPLYLLCTEKLESSELTIRTYAARIAQQIRAVQPAGPYRVGGFCFAGFVAFEVARELISSGAELAGLCIVDRPGPSRLYRWMDRAKKSLHRTAVPYPMGPGWVRRGRLAREFRPTGVIAEPVCVVETGHSRRRHNPDRHRGWKEWVSNRLEIHIDHAIGPAAGINEAVRRMALPAHRIGAPEELRCALPEVLTV
jgi:amino acid adenylation domain-containing protein